jgi:hypothetical protein
MSDRDFQQSTRSAWEWGVVEASAVMLRSVGTEAERNRIMAETMGLLHGTMGEGRK